MIQGVTVGSNFGVQFLHRNLVRKIFNNLLKIQLAREAVTCVEAFSDQVLQIHVCSNQDPWGLGWGHKGSIFFYIGI